MNDPIFPAHPALQMQGGEPNVNGSGGEKGYAKGIKNAKSKLLKRENEAPGGRGSNNTAVVKLYSLYPPGANERKIPTNGVNRVPSPSSSS